MKKIIFSVLLLAIGTQLAFAQLEGKRFISGSAGLSFSNTNLDQSEATNGYGYGIELNLGKFKRDNFAAGFSLRSTLSGGKQSFFINNQSQYVDGINGFTAGAGYFWQFYKHFGTRFGIFGGPDVSLSYEFAKTTSSESGQLNVGKSYSGLLGMTVSGGAYFALNERWWLLGSLGFANIFNSKYTQTHYEINDTPDAQVIHNFRLGFQPYINFPSVSLGLRCFLRN